MRFILAILVAFLAAIDLVAAQGVRKINIDTYSAKGCAKAKKKATTLIPDDGGDCHVVPKAAAFKLRWSALAKKQCVLNLVNDTSCGLGGGQLVFYTGSSSGQCFDGTGKASSAFIGCSS